VRNGMPRRSEVERNEGGQYMHYVYILQSIDQPEHFYVGITIDLRNRLLEHNNGQSVHTNKFKPWRYRTVISFDDVQRAKSFETYLKSSSGRAFAKRHF